MRHQTLKAKTHIRFVFSHKTLQLSFKKKIELTVNDMYEIPVLTGKAGDDTIQGGNADESIRDLVGTTVLMVVLVTTPSTEEREMTLFRVKVATM